MGTQSNEVVRVIAGISGQEQNSPAGVRGRPFPPGESGNPSGRPKIKRISDAYAAILDDHGAEALAERVYCDALTAKNPSDRLAAIQEITDRVEGKAVQTTRIEQALDGQTAKVLADLAMRLMPLDGPNTPLLEAGDLEDTPLSNEQLTDASPLG